MSRTFQNVVERDLLDPPTPVTHMNAIAIGDAMSKSIVRVE